MNIHNIAGIIGTEKYTLNGADCEIRTLATDSRTLTTTEGALFFAIRTKSGDGCRYIKELYERGVRNFVVPDDFPVSYNDANVWYVKNVVGALQRIATSHRSEFNIPVVGITGSNGKTIVKDWLVQLLGTDRKICSSPKSYNSQIGVPLSVWQLGGDDRMAIFEAGISEPGEMALLQPIIRPSIGIFTNIGGAHDENFQSRSQKIGEKLKLFRQCEVLIYCADHKDIGDAIEADKDLSKVRRYTWGRGKDADLQLIDVASVVHGTSFKIRKGELEFEVAIPFSDQASRQNVMHCIALMSYLEYPIDQIASGCARLTQVEMRMEIIEATAGCLLINDSYSLDMGSLAIALDTLQHDRRHLKHTLIMSDLVQTGIPEEELYRQVATLLRQKGVNRMIAIGRALGRNKQLFEGIDTIFYDSTDEFVAKFERSMFSSETILLKGARVFGFERIAKLLQRRSHETIMEVNLNALIHNLAFYRSRINSTTKLMAMVKAASYGAGKVEVASALQWSAVDYLTVAYADEGVELRRGGISVPIMVMNPEEAAFDDIIRYHLEPDIYSFRILENFGACAANHGECVPIHIEFDTGMHRLGYTDSDIDKLAEKLNAVKDTLCVRSMFSHLACSEDPSMDDFTRGQIAYFRACCDSLKQKLTQSEPVMCHILNSSGITRFPEAQMDMVRLGIGLYGISPESDVQSQLQEVSKLVTRISQIKTIPAGDSVGYNRVWVAQRPTRLAILSVGYADGLNRHLGGKGHVLIAGHKAPIVGKVCMDMCFVDVTGIDCAEGDRAVFFGEGDLLESNAAAAGTITYELLTNVSPRVRRIYIQE